MSEKLYTFELDENEANVVLAALGELPAKHTTGLINKIQHQASAQNVAAVAESTSAPELLTEAD